MKWLDGNKTLIYAVAQAAVGLALMYAGEREVGLGIVISAGVALKLRDVTDSPASWRRPRKAKPPAPPKE